MFGTRGGRELSRSWVPHPAAWLAVEVDGAGHDAERDARRDAWLARSGVRVLRVKAWLGERHVSVVLEAIRAAL